MNPIKILLAEDHMIVLEGLRLLLEAERDLKIVGEAQTGRMAVEMTRSVRSDVVLMDIAMPQLNGLEAARQILHTDPACRILILSAHENDAYIERAIEIGVAGFLIKQTSANILGKAVRAVAAGKSFFSPSVARRISRYEKSVGIGGCVKHRSIQLTSREMEVLQLIAEGMANKQTASELGISIKTVEKHRQSLMNKLNVHDTAGLTRHAIDSGIIQSG